MNRQPEYNMLERLSHLLKPARYCYHGRCMLEAKSVSQRKQLQCFSLAALSFVIIAGWQELVIRYYYLGNQTALFCTGSKQKVPERLRAGTYLFPEMNGYDGQFYRYLAHDPFFDRGFSRNMDDARHRTKRILIPIIAWTVSGAHDAAIDRMYQYVVVTFCAFGVYWTSAYCQLASCPFWLGMSVFLLLPATLTSIDRMLVDGPLCALFVAFLYYARLHRWKPLYVVVLLAPMVRETGFLLLAGVILAAVFERQWKRAATFSTAAVPALLWGGFVVAHTAPSGAAAALISKPVFGLFVRLFAFRHEYAAAFPMVERMIVVIHLLSMLGYILCLGIAASRLWVSRNKPSAAVIAVGCFLLLGLALGNQEHLAEAYGYARPLSPLILWIVLQALEDRQRIAVVPPALVSAGIGLQLVSPTFGIVKALLHL